jgi:glucuronate isomerase
MLPTFRPDKGMKIRIPEQFRAWVDNLAEVTNIDIKDFKTYLDALRKRHDYFHSAGCRVSDHDLNWLTADPYTEQEIVALFNKVRGGGEPDLAEAMKFEAAMMHYFAEMDHEKNWTQQIHYGAMRNNNSRLFKKYGPDAGCDSIGNLTVANALSRLLDRLDEVERLPKTILYNSNPADNELMATLLGNFQGGTTRARLQYGSGWWFMDQLNGMTRQMETLSNMGLFATFVGMVTDSRSFLSYTRHEYFRRLLCNILGGDIEAGLIPRDFDLVGDMVKDICYINAAGYFGFNLPTKV